MTISAAEWRQWKQSTVTLLFRHEVMQKLQDLQAALADDGAESFAAYRHVVGKCQSLEAVLNYEPELEEIENAD